MEELKRGQVYESQSNGYVRYDRDDICWGQFTYQFTRLEDRNKHYIEPSQLDNFLALPDKGEQQ